MDDKEKHVEERKRDFLTVRRPQYDYLLVDECTSRRSHPHKQLMTRQVGVIHKDEHRGGVNALPP